MLLALELLVACRIMDRVMAIKVAARISIEQKLPCTITELSVSHKGPRYLYLSIYMYRVLCCLPLYFLS